MPTDPTSQHIAGARRRLTHLAGLADRTAAAERRILDAANDRRSAVDVDLGKLRPQVDLDDSAADRYQSLTLERGRLDTVIARARQVLEL